MTDDERDDWAAIYEAQGRMAATRPGVDVAQLLASFTTWSQRHHDTEHSAIAVEAFARGLRNPTP